MHIISNLKKFLGLGITVLLFAVYFSFPNFVRSGILDNVTGYGWGVSWIDTNLNGIHDAGEDVSNGIIFNCASDNPGICANSNYGLNIDASGNISGFAWSSTYGWLKFGGLSGFPVGAGTTSANAKLVGTNVTGWARFCSVAANPSLCAGVTVPNTANGGWDGWVSLNGTGYGVSLSGGNALTGNAWGGDDLGKNVVGWINFSNVSYTTLNQAVKISMNGQGGTSSNPATVASGALINLAWNTVNMTSCNAANDWSGVKPVSGSLPVFNVTNNTASPIIKIYTLNCTGPSSTTGTDQVYISIAPAIIPNLILTADTITVYPTQNYQTTLRWTSNVALSGCVANSTTGNLATVPSWDGAKANPSIFPATAPSQLITAPYNPTRFDLRCFNGATPIDAVPVFVSRGTLPETVTLSSSNIVGISPNFSTTLSWTTLNTVPGSCIATGGWSGSVLDNSTQSVNVPQIAPLLTTYTLTCTGLYSKNQIPVSLGLNENSSPASSSKSPRYIEH